MPIGRTTARLAAVNRRDTRFCFGSSRPAVRTSSRWGRAPLRAVSLAILRVVVPERARACAAWTCVAHLGLWNGHDVLHTLVDRSVVRMGSSRDARRFLWSLRPTRSARPTTVPDSSSGRPPARWRLSRTRRSIQHPPQARQTRIRKRLLLRGISFATPHANLHKPCLNIRCTK